MDDLMMIADLNSGEPAPLVSDLRPARDRLLAAAAAERAGQPTGAELPATALTAPTPAGTGSAGTNRPALAGTGSAATKRAAPGLAATSRPGRRRRPGWRLSTAAGLTVGAAATITAVLVLAPTTQIAGRPPVAVADAKQVLHQAAVAAARQPNLRPRPNQFVFIETSQGGPGVSTTARRVWLSADGTRDGLVVDRNVPDGGRALLPGCRDGRQPARDKQDRVIPGQTQECSPIVGYRADLPTTTDAMLAYLLNNGSGGKGDTNALGKDVLTLTGESYVPPRSRAALYEAVGRIPGMQAIPDAVDAAGRHGVGVSWLRDGSRMTLIFDRATFTFLGTAYTAPPGTAGTRPGQVTGTTALLRIAVVNRPGQLP